MTSTTDDKKPLGVAIHGIPTTESKVLLAGSLAVPAMAIGTWAWGDSTWGYKPEMFDDVAATWDALGENQVFYDTAEVYGRGESERIIGLLLKRQASLPEFANRPKPIIATKFLPLPWLWSYPSCLISALKASLERMGLDQVDLYQIHGPVHLRSIEVVGDGLAEAVKLGLAKTVGVSNYSTEQVIRMHKHLKEKHNIQLASNQVEFSLLRNLPLTSGHIQKCHELGVAVLAYSPLGMGRLSGKYSAANPPPSGRRFSNYDMATLEPLLEVVRRIAETHSTSMSSVALNYTICKGTIPLGGARNADQARQNAKALGWRLSEAELAELDEHSIKGDTGRFWQHG